MMEKIRAGMFSTRLMKQSDAVNIFPFRSITMHRYRYKYIYVYGYIHTFPLPPLVMDLSIHFHGAIGASGKYNDEKQTKRERLALRASRKYSTTGIDVLLVLVDRSRIMYIDTWV